MSKIRSICVYCGSKPGKDKYHVEGARIIGREMARNDIRLVYGGGTAGIMGEIANSVAQSGGDVLGIIPEFLLKYERKNANPKINGNHLGELVVTQNMHERKHKMFDEADAFITLPGGIGTLEEIVEMMTWAQLDRHRKPMAFANINGFWSPMLELIKHMDTQGFIHHSDHMMPIIEDDPSKVIERVLSA